MSVSFDESKYMKLSELHKKINEILKYKHLANGGKFEANSESANHELAKQITDDEIAEFKRYVVDEDVLSTFFTNCTQSRIKREREIMTARFLYEKFLNDNLSSDELAGEKD